MIFLLIFILYFNNFFQVYADYQYYRRKDGATSNRYCLKALEYNPNYFDAVCLLARVYCYPIKTPIRTTIEKEIANIKYFN